MMLKACAAPVNTVHAEDGNAGGGVIPTGIVLHQATIVTGVALVN